MYPEATQHRSARFRSLVFCCRPKRCARRFSWTLGPRDRNGRIARLTRNTYRRSQFRRGWIRWFQRNGGR
jgi:hypothetical protein